MEDEGDICVVIDPKWTVEQINAAFDRHEYFDVTTRPETHVHTIETLYYHTNHQKYRDCVGVDYDSYWSADGEGKSSITVALIEF